jgi:hypothetical protein
MKLYRISTNLTETIKEQIKVEVNNKEQTPDSEVEYLTKEENLEDFIYEHDISI